MPEPGGAVEFPSLDSRAWDERYGADYFFGKTSGYPETGYAAAHPDWRPWLDLIQQLIPSGSLVDLGCAYGYLVQEARARGFRSVGLDISSFALQQEPELRPFLVRAHLSRLPLASECADVVCLFDVLEHLEHPLQALDEALRILSPEGLLVGATPDPIHFPRTEETHLHERPPSYWVEGLRERGLEVRFRFSVEAFNFQFLAAPGSSEMAGRLDVFGHDYFSSTPDFVSSPGDLEAVPRANWGPLRQASRRLDSSPATLYLYNRGPGPRRMGASFEVRHGGGFATLRVRLDSLVVSQVSLDSEQTVLRVELPEIQVPAGGHHLFFETLTPQAPDVFIGSIHIESRPGSSRHLVASLPFDLYQRYRFAAQAAELLSPRTILDVGGYMGDADGHLATLGDFLTDLPDPPQNWVSTDLRQGDFSGHLPAPAWKQPFTDGAFELVISLDVLEHLPAERRGDFLKELDRLASRWIVLGAPRRSSEVEAAEKDLAASLMSARPFLEEHREYGLPHAEEVVPFFQERGWHVLAFPNGYLPRWSAMQALTQFIFGLHDASLFGAFNRCYNQAGYPYDLRHPAYRTIWLMSRSRLDPELAAKLEACGAKGPDPGLEELLLAQSEFLQLEGRIVQRLEEDLRLRRDLQFLINERQKLIGLQQREIAALRLELEETPLWRLARRRWRQRRNRE